MLQLLQPDIHGFVDAVLDAAGNPVKITCDVLKIIQFSLDSQTAPEPSLFVTFGRVDPRLDYMMAGPQTIHTIVGLELIEVLENPAGITVEVIETSVLKTGIPSSHIRPEDLAPFATPETTTSWSAGIIDMIKKYQEKVKQGLVQEQRAYSYVPRVPNMVAMPTTPSPEQP